MSNQERINTLIGLKNAFNGTSYTKSSFGIKEHEQHTPSYRGTMVDRPEYNDNRNFARRARTKAGYIK